MAYKTQYDPVFSYFATLYLSISNCLFTPFCIDFSPTAWGVSQSLNLLDKGRFRTSNTFPESISLFPNQN